MSSDKIDYFIVLLPIILSVLKLAGVISVSWVIVWAPFWVPVSIAIITILFFLMGN